MATAKPLHLLILEDHPADAELMVDELRQAGFDPSWKRVETQADYLAQIRPDLDIILADYNLPQFDGLTALTLLQEQGLDIPFILVSGSIGEERAVAAMKQGAADYLLKDRLTRLGQAVERALEQKTLREVQQQMVDALRQSEAKAQAVLAALPDLMFIVKQDGTFVDYRASETASLYVPRDQIIGKTVHELMPLPIADALSERIETTLETTAVQLYEYSLPMSLETRFYEARFVKCGEDEVVSVVRDITERKRTEDELARYQEHLEQLVEQRTAELNRAKTRLEAILHHTTDGITLTSLEHGIEQANIMFNQLFACTPERYFGQSLLSLIQPDDRERMGALIEAVVADGIGRHEEFRAVRMDKTVFDARIGLGFVQAQNLRDANLVCSIQDISDLKAREQLLRYHASLQENVTDAVIATDLDFRIQSWNPAAERIYGWRAEEVLGRWVGDILPTEFASTDSADRVKQTFLERGFWSDEVTQYHKQGRALQILNSTVLFKDEQGQPLGVVAVNHDITLRKQSEEVLRQALAKEKELGELKSRFVSMASHELRTPLATILALSETLSAYRHKLTDDQIAERLDKIKNQVTYLKGIIEDVLQLARIQAGRLDFNPVLLDLDTLCRSVIDEFQNRPDVPQQWVYQCEPALQRAILDKKLMRQIISNLVANAVKYSPEGKTIFISLDYEHEAVTLRVRDEGIGIPESDLNHLFEPFHRAANVGTIAGTGLGLSITKEAVELHGGTISVESQVGLGTTFTVTIPVEIGNEN